MDKPLPLFHIDVPPSKRAVVVSVQGSDEDSIWSQEAIYFRKPAELHLLIQMGKYRYGVYQIEIPGWQRRRRVGLDVFELIAW